MLNILLYDTGDSRGENNEPLGIEVIGGRLQKVFPEDVLVSYMWFNRDGIPHAFEQYDLVGISLNLTRLHIFCDIHTLISQCRKRIPIVVGNTMATYGYKELLSQFDNIICSLGEGEETFCQIVSMLLSKHLEWEKVSNLAFIKNGSLIETKRTIADLSQYVVPYRAFSVFLRAQKGIARAEASRGCSWSRCAFCCINHKYGSSYWRPIAIDSVVNQICELVNQGLYSIYFTDEDFIGSDIQRFQDLVAALNLVKEKGGNYKKVNYFISAKVCDVLNPKVFEVFQRFIHAGLREIFLGIESGSVTQLKRYNKCATPMMNEKALALLDGLDVSVDVGFIMFDPEMTINELAENISFVSRTKLYKYGANIIKRLRIESYTELAKIFQKSGRFDLDNVEFDYSFRDTTIQKIYDSYMEWNCNFDYALQTNYRGEVNSTEERQINKQKLIARRVQEFEKLQELYAHFTKAGRK